MFCSSCVFVFCVVSCPVFVSLRLVVHLFCFKELLCDCLFVAVVGSTVLCVLCAITVLFCIVCFVYCVVII